MKYRLRKEYSTNPDKALKEILLDRGVQDIENFMNPSAETCELNPYDLENIDAAADRLDAEAEPGCAVDGRKADA